MAKRQLSPPVMAAALRIRPVLFLAGERARGTALCIRHRSCAAGRGFAAPPPHRMPVREVGWKVTARGSFRLTARDKAV